MTISYLLAAIRSYAWSSYRRKLVDTLLEKNCWRFVGIVLDIGGRDRGRFKKPKKDVKKWIFADINAQHQPDIVLDVAEMTEIQNESIDTLCACELFEHVEQIEKGLDECMRVLQPNGSMVISVPFLSSIHADPSDYQRWTIFKWRKEFAKRGCHIETLVVTGRFFTVMADFTKAFFNALPKPFHWILLLFSPLLDVLVLFDSLAYIQNHSRLGKFHGGYFMIIKKRL